MFNPLSKMDTHKYTISTQGFIADDPVSLYDFFHDWEGKYSPNKSDNYALEFARVDIGKSFGDYYIGYFYQRDTFIRTNRGFVDGYYNVKNSIKPLHDTDYDLELEIDGVIRHGLLMSKSFKIVDDDSRAFSIGVGGFISYSVDVQDGVLKGKGTIYPDGKYDASGVTTYYYMENLLYDLDVEDTYGLGYGFDISMLFVDKDNDYSVTIAINDLLSYTYWKNLPYSLVYIETQNQEFNGDYVSYNPTIHGWELYKDFKQKIEPKYNVEFSKLFFKTYTLDIGVDYIHTLSLPYIKASKIFDSSTISCQFDYRYHTFGLEYINQYIDIKLFTNGFKNASAVGFSFDLSYDF